MIVGLCSKFAQESFHNYQDLLVEREEQNEFMQFAQKLLGDF
jgi:hypothetical protein